jgi:acyl carrier protein
MATSSTAGAVGSRPDAAAIQDWIINYLVKSLNVGREAIDPNAPFDELGVDSAAAIALTGDLEDWLGRKLSPTLAYEYPSIDELARHLAESA